MAITEVSTPRKSIDGYDSYTASTAQLLYAYNENDLGNRPGYVFVAEIPELSNLQLFYLPDSSGDITFDLGPVIERGMAANNVTSLAFTVNYSASWTGGTDPGSTTTKVFAIWSRRQIKSSNGSNLYEYLAKVPSGKALTMFDEPQSWEDFKQNHYFIEDDNLESYKINIEKLDINKQLISQTSNTITSTGDGLQENEVSYASDCFYKRVIIVDTLDNTVIEQKDYKMSTACNPSIMVEWLNSLGSIDRYLFKYEQGITNIADSGYIYERPINEDIVNAEGNKFRHVPKDVQYITLKADHLTQNEIQALHDIKISNLVKLVKPDVTNPVYAFSDAVERTILTTSGSYVTIAFEDNVKVTSETGFSDTLDFMTSNSPAQGQGCFLWANTGHTITITHNFQTASRFLTLDAQPLVLNPEEGAYFVRDANLFWQQTATPTVTVEGEKVNVIVNAGYETTFTTGKSAYEFTLNVELPNDFDFFKL